jgi:hypothetical protein
MCTVSWWRRGGCLSLRFNRDEQRQRPPAEKPALQDGLIWPRDPQGGGTWMCVDAAGTVHCLLNFYDAVSVDPPAHPRSRGELPLLSARNPEPILSWLKPVSYLPFHLLRIPRAGAVTHIRWDGSHLSQAPAHPEITHWTSSGWNSQAVVQARGELFDQLLAARGISEEMLHDFHFKKNPENAGYWPWMSRTDAKTVSISEIKVDESRIRFSYSDLTEDRMLPPYEIFQPIQKG